jgi:transposase
MLRELLRESIKEATFLGEEPTQGESDNRPTAVVAAAAKEVAMRKMQDFVVVGKSVYVGLEDSKKTWSLCVRCEGQIIQETSMPAEYEGLRRYLLHRYPKCTVAVAYEAGFGGFWLHDALEGDGIRCEVIPPNKVTQEKDSRVKNDKIDARRLAKVLESDDYKSCHVPDVELRQDRQISRCLVAIQKDLTRVQARIKQFFLWHHLSDVLGEHWRATAVAALRQIELPAPLRFGLDIYLRELETLLDCRTQLRRQLLELSRKPRYRKAFESLESAPGIGWQTAIRLVLEWGENLNRFRSGKAFANFLGLTGSEHSTAEDIHRGHITGQGNQSVRAWLIECSWIAYKRDPVLLHKYLAVQRRSGSGKKAIVAVARKLAVRLWHLVTHGQQYVVGLQNTQPAA